MTKTTWMVIAVIVIIVALVAGLLPLPGQKDNVTPHSQPAPAGQSPQPTVPTGPPAKQPPPGETAR